jgi:formate hydrogenlyase transcriptional activator
LVDTIPRETLGALTRYPWPGNIRELENVIERAVILSNGRDLRVPPGDLRCRIAPVQNDEKNLTLEEVERNHILMTLKATRWVVSGPRGAAARLGLKRQTLNFRMKKLGIMRPGTEPWRHEISSGTGRVAHPGILVGELP